MLSSVHFVNIISNIIKNCLFFSAYPMFIYVYNHAIVQKQLTIVKVEKRNKELISEKLLLYAKKNFYTLIFMSK